MMPKKDIDIPEYKIAAHTDRPHNRWGGVAMYIHNDIPYEEREREDLQHKHIESFNSVRSGGICHRPGKCALEYM